MGCGGIEGRFSEALGGLGVQSCDGNGDCLR